MECNIKLIQKRQAVRCMIVAMVDACHGSLQMDAKHIKTVYNRHSDDVVVFVLQDGSKRVLGDMDTDIIDADIREWQSKHQTEFNIIMSAMHNRG